MENEETSFFDRIDEIVEADGRYRREAYFFIYSALDHTVRAVGRDGAVTPGGRHVSGQELSWGIAEYGRRQFGPLVRDVFEHWGVRQTLDFGRIVFSLVDNGLMSKTERDSVEDFRDVYDFDDAFDPAAMHSELKEFDLDRL